MEFYQVRYFLAVCDTLNFTRAAESCNVSQPALTKAVKKLEDELGGDLFRRERNQTHLTELGRVMRPFLEQTYESAQAAKAQATNFRNLETAPLRLGIMCTIGPRQLMGFFAELRDALPQLELTLKEAPGNALVDGMLSGDIDLALLGLPQLPERFDRRPLYSERYVIAFAPGHRFETMAAVSYADLDGENYLQRENCEFSDHMHESGDRVDISVNVVCRSEREDWIQSLIAAGSGCAIMPEYLPNMPGIVTRPLVEPELKRTIDLVSVSGRQYAPASRIFVDNCMAYEWVPD